MCDPRNDICDRANGLVCSETYPYSCRYGVTTSTTPKTSIQSAVNAIGAESNTGVVVGVVIGVVVLLVAVIGLIIYKKKSPATTYDEDAFPQAYAAYANPSFAHGNNDGETAESSYFDIAPEESGKGEHADAYEDVGNGAGEAGLASNATYKDVDGSDDSNDSDLDC